MTLSPFCPRRCLLPVSTRSLRIVQVRFLCLFVLLSLFSSAPSSSCEHQRNIVVLDAADMPRPQKEALLILPGLRSRSEGVKDIRNYFAHKGYDLYLPDYIGRDSIDQCVTNLDRFIRDAQLAEYRRVHVFAYILGAWTLNRWIGQHPDNNIATIVYDRSPLQERAAYAVVHDIPILTRWFAGKIVEEFSRTPYEPVPGAGRRIGVIMESRATRLIRKHREAAMSLGEVSWDVADRGQVCDDFFYTLNNHDDMYHDFSFVGREVLRFISEGRFNPDAPRAKPDIEPFLKRKPRGSP